MLDDDLLEYSWTYRATVEKGRVEEARQNVETVIQARFPALLKLAQSRTEHLTDLAKLRQISFTVSSARSEREAKKYLHTLK